MSLKAARDRALSKPSGRTNNSTLVPPRPLESSEYPSFEAAVDGFVVEGDGAGAAMAPTTARITPLTLTTLTRAALFVTLCPLQRQSINQLLQAI